MLNFRKLKQDFSSSILKEGKDIYDDGKVVSAKLLQLDGKVMKITGRIQGQFENHYESEIEIDRLECEAIDSNCDCPYNYDCHHIAALLYYLEHHIDKILVSFSKEVDLDELSDDLEKDAHEEIIEKLREAETKETQKQEENYQKQVLQEYAVSSQLLGSSPFFRPEEAKDIDKAELAVMFNGLGQEADRSGVDFQIALRLPSRSKPLHVQNLREFFEAVRYEESIFISGKKYRFALSSFDAHLAKILKTLLDNARFPEGNISEKSLRIGCLSYPIVGSIFAELSEYAANKAIKNGFSSNEEDLPVLPGVYDLNLENPVHFSLSCSALRFVLEYIHPPSSKLLINPQIVLDSQTVLNIEEGRLFECVKTGMLYKNVYYRFSNAITRYHLRNLKMIRDITIPEPLFGSFVENSLPELMRYAEVANQSCIEHFVTIPYVNLLKAICNLSFLNGELEAEICFEYNGSLVPAHPKKLSYDLISSFVSKQGVLGRNLVEEKKILDELFQDFFFQQDSCIYITKSEKKIVEFMTDVVPRNQHRVTFNCPQNLLDQFIYDQTTFKLKLSHTDRIDVYEIDLKVEGALKGVKMDLLWECMATKKAFIEMDQRSKVKKAGEVARLSKILVLDLDRLSGVIQIFDEMGIQVLDDRKIERPLWSIASIDSSLFENLPVEFSITDRLLEIRQQMLGEKNLQLSEVPAAVKATLRSYQLEGTQWLERLRLMYLSGILADDMGLGKTLQAIVAITQIIKNNKSPTLIVCPTSLLYNWKEEFAKFNPAIQAIVIDGTPQQRKKLLEQGSYHVIITSYTLLQKDIDLYKELHFSYAILDEAQHIKNRGTRNAKSVKSVIADHRLILSGTPIENSLDELWSLFDFLMPGFLSTYDRFMEKYVRVTGQEQTKNLEYLKKKVSPFILRRMKSDVLDDLPPVSEIVYHCQLSPIQMELYRSYAQSARDELVKLVERDGFDRVQIHVLATLTRLKQICCHPAIFAKEKAEMGDSAKYDMLVDLVQTLIEGKHKTVIFSQYTKMLQIMREDFEQKGIRFSYLDGSSKNRLEVVKQFNEDDSQSVFLVSLKAGGTGLNLVGADTVIHYDMWWNPAVEAQATDRVHRMGQKQSVSSYKLITLGTIEEKIAEMQKRKKGLVKKVVSCDDEAISKLTWEDVLELLKT